MPKISIDSEKCLGCESCTQICPRSFEMKNGKAHPKKTEVEQITCEKDAEAGCPNGAISISD